MKRFKVIFFFLVCLMFVWHFTATFLYNLGYERLSPPVQKVVGYYMLPLFHQNWKLFAPDPPTYDITLFTRYRTEGEWKDWEDLGFEFLLKHYNNRFSYSAKLYFRHEHHARNLITLYNRHANCFNVQNRIVNQNHDSKDCTLGKTEIFESVAEYHKKYLLSRIDELEAFQFSVVELNPSIVKDSVVKKVILFNEIIVLN